MYSHFIQQFLVSLGNCITYKVYNLSVLSTFPIDCRSSVLSYSYNSQELCIKCIPCHSTTLNLASYQYCMWRKRKYGLFRDVPHQDFIIYMHTIALRYVCMKLWYAFHRDMKANVGRERSIAFHLKYLSFSTSKTKQVHYQQLMLIRH